MVFLQHLDLNPSTSFVLSECEQEGLITRDQREDIVHGLRKGGFSDTYYAVFKLVKLMKRSGNEGYEKFRKILEKRSDRSLANKNLFTKLVGKEDEVHHSHEAACKAVSKGSLLCTLEVLITLK